MTSRFEDLERLARLLDENKVTPEEYQALKAELLSGEGVLPLRAGDTRKPWLYWTSLALGVVSVFLGGTFGLIAWASVLIAVVALTLTKSGSGRWMAWTGLALGIVFSFMNLWIYGHLVLGGAEPSLAASPASTTLVDLPVTSVASTTTTKDTTTTTKYVSPPTAAPPKPTTTAAPGPDEGEMVESLRRASEAIGQVGGVVTSIDLMTDQQVVQDVKSLCAEVGGSGQGFQDRVDEIKGFSQMVRAAEVALLAGKATWAIWYCPEYSTQLKQVADWVHDAFAEAAGSS